MTMFVFGLVEIFVLRLKLLLLQYRKNCGNYFNLAICDFVI